jgi:hypothetical protein
MTNQLWTSDAYIRDNVSDQSMFMDYDWGNGDNWTTVNAMMGGLVFG